MQINNIQSQQINNNNTAFGAKLKLNDKTDYRRIKNFLRRDSKQKEFDSLFERFSNNHVDEVVTMGIVTKNGLEYLKVNRVGSAVECLVPISNEKEYLFPIASVLRETMENPNFSVMWTI